MRDGDGGGSGRREARVKGEKGDRNGGGEGERGRRRGRKREILVVAQEEI